MPIDIKIEDNDLVGFNQQAKDELVNSITEFSDDLITEANRIESQTNSTSQGPEVTSSMVRDAKVLLRHKLGKPQTSTGSIILKILATLFVLLSGIMYQPDKLKAVDEYMVFYIIVIALAILFTTLTFIKEK